ncbi:hypothetical protein AVEN_21713-1 [Araneus ventricosus]|uniref:CCHC-type domain-containing protein n=1 Tax=Araneus ventricosus TaxID=182803 RepID=A0A4Y2TFM4_ARAVE|nr:hypothetical protein AVEN_199612-1 [Araneus ventricosus]GBO11065.1 hypothetical protein AVEN_21713-1 [Araneus ventricosus]
MSKDSKFVDNLGQNLSQSFKMPKPVDKSSVVEEGSKNTRGPGTSSQSRTIPNIDDIVKKINGLNLDKDLTEFLINNLQDLSKLFTTKARDIKAAVRDVKVRDCENTIEALKAKLQLVNSDLLEAKDDLKKTSSALVETAKERDSHAVPLRPKKPSSSEDNIKAIENVLTARNSPLRISRIGKVSQGGLIIQAPTDADLKALEAEINCLPYLEDRFTVSRPKRRRPQIIILGVDNAVDKDRLTKGLLAKKHFLADSKNNPLIETVFSIKARRSTNWGVSVDPGIYKMIFDQPGLYFEFSRLRFDNFFGVKQCRHCRCFGHTTKWCP